mmetsp:Transcript_30298/g.88611  ORF Transcript_30298/g.88611 Transcript_30298/m.88611 type:complete len:235 (-) Transcript_30298:1214-1918(-)
MKRPTIFLLCLVVSQAHAFVVSVPNFHCSRPSSLRLSATSRPDASAFVEEALRLTSAFGIDSKEARLAWEAVEELDSSDTSPASKGSYDVECDVNFGSAPAKECMDYALFLEELFNLRDALDLSAKVANRQKAGLVDALKVIKLNDAKGVPAKSSAKLTAALEAAKKATSQHGIQSAEARLAWEEYEEIASSGLDNAIGVTLDDECQYEYGSEACKAIEELDRVLPILQSLNAK